MTREILCDNLSYFTGCTFWGGRTAPDDWQIFSRFTELPDLVQKERRRVSITKHELSDERL